MGLSHEERAEIERKGGVVRTVQDFLGLSDIEMEIIELRIKLGREVKGRRKAARMTQKALADRLQVARPRIPGIESGASVSLETLISAFFATGGTRAELAALVGGVA